MDIISKISKQLKSLLSFEGKSGDEQGGLLKGHKVIAFLLAVVFSLSMWFIVNMGRDYSVTIDIPLRVVNMPSDIALSNEIPEKASVSLSGEGWKLINLYTNPPTIQLNAETQQINLFEQVRQQVGALSELNVLQVEPIVVSIETEQRVSKRVPIVTNVDIELKEQYGIIGSPRLEPDSVTVTGAASRMAEIDSWDTRETEFRDISSNLEVSIDLVQPEGAVQIDPASTLFRVEVAEFTEAEVRIPIRTRNLPSGKAVTYNPSSITVRYDVPIEQFSAVQDTRPFVAYVDYSRIEDDTTGLITPEIERVSDEFDVRLRSFQPTRVSYFNILPP